MTIREQDVRAVTVGELLDPGQHDSRIPPYQRPYSWEPATALQLVDDIVQAQTEANRGPYVLGAVILHRVRGRLDVVDGQQRALTLRMITSVLAAEALLSPLHGGDNPVVRVWAALTRRLASMPDDDRRALASFIRDKCQVVCIVTDNVDEAFRVFDSQNYRGKPLEPHDLLKAHHLREMQDETPVMKAAVVEEWERVPDRDLARLFSTYLYRVYCWMRGEEAPGFSVHDIGMFKGVPRTTALTPAYRYHFAAQEALPLLNSWAATDPRDHGRSRFQMDTPIRAGRHFFEMVDFMLHELPQVVLEAYPDDLHTFCPYDLDLLRTKGILAERPSRSRYRYVGELYVAALLYYTSRFGQSDFDHARPQIFAWAYAPRVQMLRVQYRTIDNRARGGSQAPPLFSRLRNATTPRVINELVAHVPEYRDGHEAQLVSAMRGAAT